AAAFFRLRSCVGFSENSRRRSSVRTPAFSQARLKRRRAASKYSFSRTRTLGIQTSNVWRGRRHSATGGRILKGAPAKGKGGVPEVVPHQKVLRISLPPSKRGRRPGEGVCRPISSDL